MNLCDSMHEEVCYNGRNCPVCEMEADKDEVISGRDDEIGELKAEINILKETK